jgi:lipid-A-disaccharide synthase-like uncharacterized protein
MTDKKKFTEQELEHSTRIFKSATPKYTLDWYLKWIASISVLIAMGIRGIPQLVHYDLAISIFGVGLWLIVSVMWKDRALILVNGIGLLLLINNFARMVTAVDIVG